MTPLHPTPMLAPRVRTPYVADLLLQIEAALSAGDWTTARDTAVRASQAAPTDPHTLHASGRLCELAEMPGEALTQWLHAVSIDPQLAPSWSAIGTLLARGPVPIDQHALALLMFAQAHRADPEWLLPAWHMAMLYHALGQPAAAQAALARCVELLARYGQHPKNTGTTNVHNRAYMLLTLEQWAAGFACYEERLGDVGHTLSERAAKRPPPGVPRWLIGQPTPKRLAIFAEQGAGDMLMTARYAADLARGGTEVWLEAVPALAPYFRATLTPCGVHVIDHDAPLPEPVDAYVWAMSLPGHLGVDVPLPTSGRPVRPRRQVAFCWQGSRAHKNDGIRSVDPEVFRPLAAVVRAHGLTPIALNPGEPTPAWLHDPGPIASFADSARVLEDCAAVISIDSALVHLAGSEHVPTFACLAALPDWRWGLHGETTRWYPSVTLVRQPVIGDWASVVARITELLPAVLTPAPEATP